MQWKRVRALRPVSTTIKNNIRCMGNTFLLLVFADCIESDDNKYQGLKSVPEFSLLDPLLPTSSWEKIYFN